MAPPIKDTSDAYDFSANGSNFNIVPFDDYTQLSQLDPHLNDPYLQAALKNYQENPGHILNQQTHNQSPFATTPVTAVAMNRGSQDPQLSGAGGGGALGQAAAAAGITPTLSQLNSSTEPYLQIVEQPKSRGLRFRYKCEGRSAGAILGANSNGDDRSYPTIQIHNFNGLSAIIVVSCVSHDDPPRPHPHSLVGKDCKEGVCTVKLKGSKMLQFPNLGIQCSTRKEIMESLKNREKIRVDPFGVGYYTNPTNIDLNKVRLAFQCFLPDKQGKYTRIVPPVVSQPIYDKKAVNDLVICRLSRQSGKACGGDEVFMLTEKVNKDDIQVQFFEETPGGQRSWTAFADFGQQDVHRQYAVVFRTPPYRDAAVQQPRDVYLQLLRPSDGETSDAKPFTYTPDDPDPDGIERKRKRKCLNVNSLMADMTPPAAPAYPPNIPTTLDDEAMDATDNKSVVKQRLKQRAQRKSKNAAAAAAAAASTSAAAAPHVTPVTSSGGQSLTTPDAMFRAMMDHADQVEEQPTTTTGAVETLPSLGVTFSQFLQDTGNLSSNLPNIRSFPTTQEALRGGGNVGGGGDGGAGVMTAAEGDYMMEQVVAAEEEVGGEEVGAVVAAAGGAPDLLDTLSINTQNKIFSAIDNAVMSGSVKME